MKLAIEGTKCIIKRTATHYASLAAIAAREFNLATEQIPSAMNPDSTPSPSGVSVVDLLNVLLRQRLLVISVTAAALILTALYLAFAPRIYTVKTSFVVQKKDRNSAAGLAAQLGMDLSGSEGSESPGFYAALVKTPDVLEHLADTVFQTSNDPKPRSLSAIWSISAGTPLERRKKVIDRLQRAISASPALKLDLVMLDVVTRDPLLSKDIADAVLSQINWFNLRTRQSRAGAERQFDERLLSEVQSQLRQAEDETQQFYQRNQQARLSAGLEMEKQRLARRLEIMNSRYVSLVTAYDQARIDEVRDTPVITVIEKPTLPVKPDSRRSLQKMILMLVLGALLGAVLALGREGVLWLRSAQASEAKEFARLLGDTSADMRRLKRILRRRKLV